MHQALNHAFLLIQDFKFTIYPNESCWTLFTSKKLLINALVHAHDTDLRDLGFATGNWVIIDQRGPETSTCLVYEQH
ncbi:hypothetical protein C8R44DRAFT_875728 [Mycena epipterygia]|nr:hypothetical protein C8R44DRAFT_875728 [Mycena epipterygia]